MTTLVGRVRGTAVVARAALRERRIPYLPWPEVERLRDRRAAEMARYAAETVPHYRDLFRTEGIDPRSLRTAADLERLPVLEKEAVRRAPDRFVSESPLGRSSVPFLTSGTTGMRLRIHHDRRELLLTAAYRERQRQVEVDLTGKRLRYRHMTVVRPESTAGHVRGFADGSTVLLRGRRRWVSSVDPIETIVAEIDAFRPDVVRGPGTLLELLFRTAARTDASMHAPRAVRYGGDTMTTDGRELIEREFGTRVVATYNAVEVFHVGFTCEARHAYHLCADLTHVGVLPDGAEHPVSEGRGVVVVSNLVNRGTVLLNYRLGDIATLSWEPCPCGRTGPVLLDLEGRVEDVIHLEDGAVVLPRLVWDVMKRHEAVIRYQLVQTAPAQFRLRVATETQAAYDALAGDVRTKLSSLLGGAEVETSLDPALVDVELKFRPVVALAPAPGR